MKTQKILALIAVTLLLANCAKNDKDDEGNTGYSEGGSSLESAINALGATSDDMSDTSSTSALSVQTQASSAFCQRAATQTCTAAGAGATKTASYSGCVIPYTAVTVQGNVELAFNSNNCSLSNAGDSVSRTYDVTFEGYFGATLRVSSESHQNFEGNTLGGGGQAVRTGSGWELSILGQHRVYKTPRGIEFGNVSIRTTQPVIVTGTLTKVNRTINSGAVEVAHNKAQYTAVYTPSNLHWDSTCCYPISGSLNVTHRGSSTGSANVAITGCGTAKVTYDDGTIEDKTFRYCE